MSEIIKKDFLDVDDPIAGQGFVCLSFISPESIIQKKDSFVIEEFLKSKGLDINEYESYLDDNKDDLDRKYNELNRFQTTTRGVKIRGTYDTLEAAKIRAKNIQSKDPSFHVFVAPVGYWLPWDPSADSIDQQEYHEDNLNKLMENYRLNQNEKNNFFQSELQNRIQKTKDEGQIGAQEALQDIARDVGEYN